MQSNREFKKLFCSQKLVIFSNAFHFKTREEYVSFFSLWQNNTKTWRIKNDTFHGRYENLLKLYVRVFLKQSRLTNDTREKRVQKNCTYFFFLLGPTESQTSSVPVRLERNLVLEPSEKRICTRYMAQLGKRTKIILNVGLFSLKSGQFFTSLKFG